LNVGADLFSCFHCVFFVYLSYGSGHSPAFLRPVWIYPNGRLAALGKPCAKFTLGASQSPGIREAFNCVGGLVWRNMEGSKTHRLRQLAGIFRFRASHKISSVSVCNWVFLPIMEVPRPPLANFRYGFHFSNWQQCWIAIRAEPYFAAREYFRILVRVSFRVDAAMKATENCKWSLPYIDIAPTARRERAAPANGLSIDATGYSLNGMDVLEDKPDLDHVTGFPIVRLHRCHGSVSLPVHRATVENIALGRLA
jgi:hypothetical protein